MAPIGARRSTLRLGTRGSTLAVQQSRWVQARLQELDPDITVTLSRIQTSGDKILDVPLANVGGKGLFVKEIEEALLRGEIDLAVHSMKDVPPVLPLPLDILSVPMREDPRDVLISRDGSSFAQLKSGARIGTSSLRRQAQLLSQRPDLTIHVLRGNLDTRLRKLREGQYEAIVLAAAGLARLGWTEHITEFLSPEVSLPAIGQGALAIEGRRDDEQVKTLVGKLHHGPTATTVRAERALLHRLEGSCQVPIAAHAVLHGEELHLRGLIASVDGTRLVRDRVQGSASRAEALGIELAERLLEQGGAAILQQIYGRA